MSYTMRVALVLVLYFSAALGCGIQRLFPRTCTALAGQPAADVQSRLPNLSVAEDVYDSARQVFVTEIGLDGGVAQSRDAFCARLVNDSSLPDCLGLRGVLPPTVAPGYRVNITANCSRAALPSESAAALAQVNVQLAESLRALNRAILYDAQQVSLDENSGEVTMQFMMPLVTDDTDRASQYANASLQYYFHIRKQDPACVRSWQLTTVKTRTRGIFRVTFAFAIDPGCDGASQCKPGWRPAGDQAVACEEGACYHRGDCIPDTCLVGHYGSACTKCETGKYSLRAGQVPKQKTGCDAIPPNNTACSKIIQVKTSKCSAGMSVDQKKKMSLVLNVDCLDGGGVKLVWGEGVDVLESKRGELRVFLGSILNVSAGNIVLELQRRDLVFDQGARRRLLQEDAVADDNSTVVTVSVQGATTTTTTTATTTPAPAPANAATTTPAPAPANAATTTPPPAKEEPYNYAIVAIVIPAAFLIFCCLLVSSQSPEPEPMRMYRVADATGASEYVPVNYHRA